MKQQQISGTNITLYREIYSFDSLGRPSQTQFTEGSNNYYVNTAYSALTGFVDTLTYPTSTSSYRLKLQYEYQHGALLRVKDFNAPTTVFWQANAASARGVVSDSTLGNGIRTVKSLDQVTGWVDYIQSGPGGGTAVQNLSYLWDRVGNLTQRQDNNQGLTENAYYDNLHRLQSATVSGGATLAMTYAPNGNVLTKSGVGTYTYHASKVHAVASINTGGGTWSYTYNANGNLTNRNGTTLTWFASNLPKAITKNSQNSSTFQYTPGGMRWRHAYKTANVTYTHVYLGSLMEKVTQGSAVDWKHYIHAEGEIVAFYSRKSSGTNTLSYLLQDHLGSTDAITASSGAVTVKESFDAFGKRRGTAWSGSPTSGELSTINGLTRRGYTAHEMLDSTDLIHMNGRVYDPLLGRFASADPYTPASLGSQAFNRFAYVGNNPLSINDPSGFTPRSRSQWIDRCGASRGCGSSGWGGSGGIDTVMITAPRLRNDTQTLSFNSSFNGGLAPNIPDIDRGMDGGDTPLDEVLVEDEKDDDKPPELPPIDPLRAPLGSQGQDGASGALCRALSALSGAAGGAVAGGTFALLTGQIGLIPAATVGGGIVGGVAGGLAPQGGIVGAMASGFGSVLTHTPGGASARGAVEIAGDAFAGGIPAGALTVPAGVVIGAGTSAVGGVLGLGALGSAAIGGHAGGLSAAAGLATTAALDALLSEVSGCSL